METRPAKVVDTFLGIEEHGTLTALITVSYGDGSHQAFGGYNLERNMGMFMRFLFLVAEVDEWSDLIGKPVMAEISEDGTIKGLANFLMPSVHCRPADWAPE